MILDEAHLYRGANGTEVAYLIRRLLDRLRLPASRVVFIATSASFSNSVAAATFVAGLTGLEPGAITTLNGSKRAFEPAAEGSSELAAALAAVPLGALQSALPRDRALVLTSLVPFAAKSLGTRVKLRRVDNGAAEIIATVHGLGADGVELEEEVLLAANETAETEQPFLIVDDVRCSEGSVAFGRRFDLGTAWAERCEWQEDDLRQHLRRCLPICQCSEGCGTSLRARNHRPIR